LVARNNAGDISSNTVTGDVFGSTPTISLTYGINALTVSYSQTLAGTAPSTYYYSLNGGSLVTAPASQFDISGLTSTTPYSIYMLVRNPAGDLSSNTATGYVFGSKPTLSLTPGISKLTVSYSQLVPGTGPTSYYYYLINAGNLTSVSTNPFDITELTDTYPYSVYLIARNLAGDISSNTLTVNVFGTVPTISSITPGTNKLTVAFAQTQLGTSPTTYSYSYSSDGSNPVGPVSLPQFEILNIQTTKTVYIVATNPAGTLVSSGSTETPNILGGNPVIGTITPGKNQLSVEFTQDPRGTNARYYYSINGTKLLGSGTAKPLPTMKLQGQCYSMEALWSV
jgi:hypothetical protein